MVLNGDFIGDKGTLIPFSWIKDTAAAVNKIWSNLVHQKDFCNSKSLSVSVAAWWNFLVKGSWIDCVIRLHFWSSFKFVFYARFFIIRTDKIGKKNILLQQINIETGDNQSAEIVKCKVINNNWLSI